VLREADVLIEQNINTVAFSIDSYAQANQGLPATLRSLNLTGDAGRIVYQHLVTYVPNTKRTQVKSDQIVSLPTIRPASTAYYYQLCATFKKPKQSLTNVSSSISGSYNTTADMSSHPAGKVCYNLTAEM